MDLTDVVNNSEISRPVVKAVTVVSLGVGSYTVQEWSAIVSIIAGATGFFYSLHLIGEWYWKKFVKDLFIGWGWYTPPPTKGKLAEDDHG